MIELQHKFIGDAEELLAKLETELINFENDIHNEAIIQELFRVMHTLKGTAGMFGFERIAEFTHVLEDIYDLVRKKTIDVTKEIIDLTFLSVDLLKILLKNNEELNETQETKFKEVFEHAKQITGGIVYQKPEIEIEHSLEHYILLKVIFKPYANIILRGISPDSILHELETLGEHIKFQYTDEQIEMEDEESYNQFFEFYFSTDVSEESITDVFLFLDDDEYKIEKLDHAKHLEKFTQTSAQLQSTNTEEIIKQIVHLLKEKTTRPKELIPEITDNNQTKPIQHEILEDSIRVPSSKLDNLLNLVSELIMIQAQFENHAERMPDERLASTVKELSKLSRNFRDEILSTRLIPISILSTSMQRLVRDLSQKLGKDVELITEGLQTELDKNIINRIEAPILHIIRNCMDHGIETPEERIKNHKKPKGIIRFIAFYSGASVFIQVQDDGRGIDPNFIKEKAVAKGIIKYNEQLSIKQIYELIFIPGFSTAGVINELSGRGVGLDIVKNEITELHGEINIDSEIGLGTSFTFKLPLTLSIVDALLTHCGSFQILIPTSNIRICKYLPTDYFQNNDLQYKFDKKCIPVKRLSSLFSPEKQQPAFEVLIIISIYEKLFGLLVDKIVTSMQAVIKPLGQMHNQQQHFIGASQLGDGSIAYVLDTNFLLR